MDDHSRKRGQPSLLPFVKRSKFQRPRSFEPKEKGSRISLFTQIKECVKKASDHPNASIIIWDALNTFIPDLCVQENGSLFVKQIFHQLSKNVLETLCTQRSWNDSMELIAILFILLTNRVKEASTIRRIKYACVTMDKARVSHTHTFEHIGNEISAQLVSAKKFLEHATPEHYVNIQSKQVYLEHVSSTFLWIQFAKDSTCSEQKFVQKLSTIIQTTSHGLGFMISQAICTGKRNIVLAIWTVLFVHIFSLSDANAKKYIVNAWNEFMIDMECELKFVRGVTMGCIFNTVVQELFFCGTNKKTQTLLYYLYTWYLIFLTERWGPLNVLIPTESALDKDMERSKKNSEECTSSDRVYKEYQDSLKSLEIPSTSMYTTNTQKQSLFQEIEEEKMSEQIRKELLNKFTPSYFIQSTLTLPSIPTPPSSDF